MTIKSISNSRIIVVDDDHIIYFIVKKMANKLKIPMEIIPFANGKEAEEYFLSDESNGYFHLLLLDINMPIMTGWDLLDSLDGNEITNNIFGYILTSSVNNSDRIKSKSYPCIQGYIEKPLEITKLEEIYYSYLGSLKDRT